MEYQDVHLHLSLRLRANSREAAQAWALTCLKKVLDDHDQSALWEVDVQITLSEPQDGGAGLVDALKKAPVHGPVGDGEEERARR